MQYFTATPCPQPKQNKDLIAKIPKTFSLPLESDLPLPGE
jgi:hypothetical protein